MEDRGQANFEVVLLQNGDVELKFLKPSGEIFSAICSAQEVGNIATALLSAEHASVSLVGSPRTPALGPISVNAAIPVTQWYFGDVGHLGQKAVIVEIGRSKIGFTVGQDQMRGLGRTLIAASWRGQVAHPSLRQLVSEFGTELRLWSSLAWSNFATKARQHANALNMRLRGRSFHSFAIIHIGPRLGARKYSALKECIYCGSKTYSQKPSVRKFPLGAEHIVAEGLGGTLELPEASCQQCEEATGALVEGAVLGKTLKAIRVHLGLRKPRSGPLPKTLPLEATVSGQQKMLEIPIEDYPIVFAMYAYATPNLNATEGMPLVVGATVVQLKLDLRMLFQKYGIFGFAMPYLDNVMMCRMLAKIGHAFAAAELGQHRFEPLLTNLIRFGNDRLEMRFIGGASRQVTKSTTSLHSLALGFQQIDRVTYVVAHIQLFANHGGPTYSVIVGKSLESPIARFKRIFSSRIRQMLAQ